jgi:hypothetical protein
MITTPLSSEFVAGLTTGEGCFDLQFHRDVRRERKNSPVYYSWKVQFVINLKNKDLELIKKLPEVFVAGRKSRGTGNLSRGSLNSID